MFWLVLGVVLGAAGMYWAVRNNYVNPHRD